MLKYYVKSRTGHIALHGLTEEEPAFNTTSKYERHILLRDRKKSEVWPNRNKNNNKKTKLSGLRECKIVSVHQVNQADLKSLLLFFQGYLKPNPPPAGRAPRLTLWGVHFRTRVRLWPRPIQRDSLHVTVLPNKPPQPPARKTFMSANKPPQILCLALKSSKVHKPCGVSYRQLR